MNKHISIENQTISKSHYIQDILDQPSVLKDALEFYPEKKIQSKILQKYEQGKFSHIVMTGLGASLNSLYPAFLELTALPIPVLYINTAELIYSALNQVTQNTLLCIASQSGRSAETIKLLSLLRDTNKPACLLGFTNNCDSPLGMEADVVVDINAGKEYSVATKTYMNTFAYATLFANQILGKDIGSITRDLYDASKKMDGYLQDWQTLVDEIDNLIANFDVAAIVGRGSSMAGVWNGALTQKEAARVQIEGYHAAEFRHGPFEMVGKGFLLMVLSGNAGVGADLNHKLALDVIARGGRAVWISANPSETLPNLIYPKVAEVASPLFEILFFQLLSILWAKRTKIVAGEFRNIGKVVLSE